MSEKPKDLSELETYQQMPHLTKKGPEMWMCDDVVDLVKREYESITDLYNNSTENKCCYEYALSLLEDLLGEELLKE